MAKKKKSKLNSMRLLEAHGVPYEVFTFPPTRHSAAQVAELAGIPPAQVYKTLIALRERGKPLLVMVAGVAGGILVGALPGLTGTMAIALLVPFTYGLAPDAALIMLGGV